MNSLDITPNPRVLRTLGEIPFSAWQCIAELIDNSLDAFLLASRKGVNLPEKRISISWSQENVGVNDRTLEIFDSGPGMVLSQIQDCVRAGYSSNDPVNNLGLFGMGFNIATARLGDRTVFLSTTADSSQWEGVEIDFAKLISSKKFEVPFISRPKIKQKEQGTRIQVSRLKSSIVTELHKHEASIKRTLEDIYAPILSFKRPESYRRG